jgi:signal peptidase I
MDRKIMKTTGKIALIAVSILAGAVIIIGYYGSIPYISPIVHGEKYLAVGGSSMQPTIKPGATVGFESVSFSDLKVDDIIVFKRPSDNAQVVGRITLVNTDGLQVKGDNIPQPYEWKVTSEMLIGKVIRINNPP